MVACKGVWTQPFWKAVTGEFLAMLIFVLLSLGSTINWSKKENPQPADLVLISLCFGLSIATLVQCFGHISGGHINPAVTIAMVCMRKISLAKSAFYIVAQCLGAIAGAGILYVVTPSSVAGGLGVTEISLYHSLLCGALLTTFGGPDQGQNRGCCYSIKVYLGFITIILYSSLTVNEKLSPGHGLLVELIITFQLLFTICASCDSKRDNITGSVALAIGFSVAIGHLFAINYTGASMNPARSFGPAVIMNKWEHHWVYWVGPVVGAVFAGCLYEYVFCPDVEIKNRLKEVLNKASKQSKGKYSEVEESKSQIESDDLLLKSGIVHVFDEKKGKDPSGEVLSSV